MPNDRVPVAVLKRENDTILSIFYTRESKTLEELESSILHSTILEGDEDVMWEFTDFAETYGVKITMKSGYHPSPWSEVWQIAYEFSEQNNYKIENVVPPELKPKFSDDPHIRY
ncbi:MAG: hypothetical protein LBQ50_05975 [Planctomycetaceae bacterium]|jgi:hypothetical protein|nr:hypothetical protein [Planctomycetaceae bacterium]